MLTAMPERVRFGVFEADVRSGELFKKGRRVKLHHQPFQVLVELIQHPGEVVTREELRRKLWPSDTFVNFDIGLNSAVRKLRGALNDSAESPRYVETLPRRGYRFIAPVVGAGEPNRDPERVIPVTPSEERPEEHPAPLRKLWERRAWLTWSLTAMALVLAISLAWKTVWNRSHGSPAPVTSALIRSLAVLPLENLSGNPKWDVLADGMTEALTTDVGEFSSLKVISRHSVTRYKGTDKPLAEIGRELDVDAFVTGAVFASQSGDRMRVDAQLVEAATGRLLWSQTYDRALGEVIGVQSEITRAVAHAVQAKLTPDQQAHLLREQSVDSQTFELYTRGCSLLTRLTEDSLRKGIEYLTQAIQRQPGFAPAHAALAEAYALAFYLAPRERFSAAKAAANRALQLDDTLPEAHSALAASLFWYDWNWAEAEREFLRAIALNPNYATAHQLYGQYLKTMGRKDWVDEVKRAGELDPVTSWFAGGGWYLETGEYDKFLAVQRTKLELDPSAIALYGQIGEGYILKHEYGTAIEYLKKGVSVSGASSGALSHLGYAYGVSGRRADALEILRQLEQLSRQRYVPPFAMTTVYAGLGQRDRAFEWLDKAYADHDVGLMSLNRPGAMDSLRSDPRFAQLKRKIGLPE